MIDFFDISGVGSVQEKKDMLRISGASLVEVEEGGGGGGRWKRMTCLFLVIFSWLGAGSSVQEPQQLRQVFREASGRDC